MKVILSLACLLSLSFAQEITRETIYENCNDGNKVCYGSASTEDDDDALTTDNSCLDSLDCSLVVTWRPNQEDDGLFDFEAQTFYEEEDPDHGFVGDGLHYVAVGFSEDEFMGEDTAVIACTSLEPLKISLYWNVRSGTFRDSLPVGDTAGVDGDLVVDGDDNWMYTAWSRPVVMSFTAPTLQGPQLINQDLTEPFYFLATAGHLEEEDGSLIVSFHDVKAVSSDIVAPLKAKA